MKNLYAIRVTNIADIDHIIEEQEQASLLIADGYEPIYHVLAFDNGSPYLVAVFTRKDTQTNEKTFIRLDDIHNPVYHSANSESNGQSPYSGSDLPQGANNDSSGGVSTGSSATR